MSTEHVPEHVLVALRVGELLDALGIAHMVCGSVASSLQGEPRSTYDVDFVVDLTASLVPEIETAFGSEFHVDAAAIRWAVDNASSCNIIHKDTAIKVDFFVLRPRRFSREELSRRLSCVAAVAPERRLFVATPEDMVLTKLEWYRRGGETSERQWRDVTGVLKSQANRLDEAYMERWANELEIADLLARAIAQSAGE
ncbi:MAG: hypothetical protein ACYTFN_09645 [Planctomycetota bacterium]